MSLLLIFYFLLLVAYGLFTYGLTAPNLTLINQTWFTNFQNMMWANIYNNRNLATNLFLILIVALFVCYGVILFQLSKQKLKLDWQKNFKATVIKYLLILSPLILSFNALSYDVFNYIFNAKMVLVYHANPHQSVALNYSFDTWTRFMHNVHTPAPYGYGWTLFSLVPYLLGLNKFLTTWLIFRLISVLALILTIKIIISLKQAYFANLDDKKFNWSLTALVFNPLMLLELISNSHNDLWMLLPAMLSLLIVGKKKLDLKRIIFSILLLAFSISTKLATVVLIPIWAFLLNENLQLLKFKLPSKFTNWLKNNWPLLASLLLFLPLTTLRSQQFLPWYLSWSLIWFPFIKEKVWRNTLLIFSLTSLLRYLPWLKINGYTPEVLAQQKLITWLLPIIYLALCTLVYGVKKIKK